jgi:murein DD-endopeptidase MepM/ murein hydrolase activator NlpD
MLLGSKEIFKRFTGFFSCQHISIFYVNYLSSLNNLKNNLQKYVYLLFLPLYRVIKKPMGLFKTRKSYYLYDQNTLSYERVYPSIKDRIFTVVRHLSSGIIIAVIFVFAFFHFFDSPLESQLRKENKLLQTQYDVLSLRLNEAFDILGSLQQRDESLYRAIFQVESIPESIRKSGFGGANRYEYLTGLPNSDLVVSTTQKMDMLTKQLYVQSNSLEELVNIGKTQEERLLCLPAIQPVANKDLKRMASGYGMRMDPIYRTPKFHAGMDFSAKEGTEIYATGNGVITYSGYKSDYGNCVMIDHGFGYQTLYGHLSKFAARVGQKVARGETIGYVGNTGKSTGPHLHYEVIVRGRHDNPSKYYFMDLSPEEYAEMIQMAENHGQVMD